MNIIKILVILIFAACTVTAEKAPNFIIFYVDDLGWSDTSVKMMNSDPESASDFHQTPSLEILAQRGMKFSNAYAPAPTCTPSRKSIQFGKTPARLKYTFVHDVLAIKRGLSWEDETSMADVLKSSGKNYITAHFGKGMGNDRMESIGYDIHDEADGSGTNGNFHGDYVDLKSRKVLPEDDPKRIYSLNKSSVNFINKYAGKRPFFLMVSQYAVHVRHKASAKVIDKYQKLPRGKYCKDSDYMDPADMTESQRNCSWRLQYAAMLDEVDWSLGQIMKAVEQAGETDNTYIIFTSDNGGGMTPNGSLAGGKANLYEGGLRVPTVIAGPGVKKGQCDVPVVQWDLLPTLHDLSGSRSELPIDLDGGSLRSVLAKGNNGKVERPVEGLVFHYPCYFAAPLSVIRIGDYKYMTHLLTGETKLFNVVKDKSEKNNLAQSMPEKASQLQTVLTRYLTGIDAENIQDVYVARLEGLNRRKKMVEEKYKRSLANAQNKFSGNELIKIKEKLQLKRKQDLERYNKNMQQLKNNMSGSQFVGTKVARKK